MHALLDYNNRFNANVGNVKDKVELIDQGNEIAIAQAASSLADIEDWFKIFSANGTRVKRHLDVYRKELEKEIRESANDAAEVEEYKQIIRDKMNSPYWCTEKKELCINNPERGLVGILGPRIITLIANENRLIYTKNASNETIILQSSLSEIHDILSKENRIVINHLLKTGVIKAGIAGA